ncbi:MAG: FHA domain-containing protein, partial [Deltaproteobacteria bacterium]|nr:FHA domain-containing protein [Deltaproteobacteria bacterium]
GAIGAGIVIELGAYRVAIAPAPAGVTASPPQRTESLARELVRSLLGDGAAPSLEVERGPIVGAKRALPPPGERGEATMVIGRGDEADWVIADEDLSRAHVEIRRGWDGVTLRDLGSKNGTLVDGVRVGQVVGPIRLGDGARIELGAVVLVFADPAERHLRGEPATGGRPTVTTATPVTTTPRPPLVRPSPWPFVIAAAIAALAVVGLAWTLAS